MSDAMTPNDPILGTDFIQELVRQMRALDTYGARDDQSPEKLLQPFVVTPAQAKNIPVVGDPDPATLARVTAFHNAIAVMIEKECRLMARPFINISSEGFGRVLMVVGKLVVLERTLRDIHRFGYPSLSRLKDEADRLLAVALERIGLYANVAGL